MTAVQVTDQKQIFKYEKLSSVPDIQVLDF